MDIDLKFKIHDTGEDLNIILKDNGGISGDIDKLVRTFKRLSTEDIKSINTQISPIDLIVLWMFYRLATRQSEMSPAP